MLKCEIHIAQELSPDLALRDTASWLLKKVESLNCCEVLVDFKGVETITRSFAHEYLIQKRTMTTLLHEENVPPNVQKMFDIVHNSEMKPRFDELRDATVINI